MRAAVINAVDGPFELVELPDPLPNGKVLVRVRAAGINFADVLVRRGRYPQMPEFPAVLGSEIAGELEDGTRVMALTSGSGGYAELATVDRAQIVPLPDNASFAEGASFLITFLSAYIPLTRQVRVRSDSTVLVYAAAGGVGTATIQVARALGARVVAAVGSAEKIEVCLELGAEEAYVYGELPQDLRVDVVVDPVGGELFAGSFARLKPLGAVVAIGSAAGAWSTIEPARLVGRNVGLYGFYLGRLLRLEPEIVGTAVGELLELWQNGALRPLVGAELPLDQVEQAHELVESRRSVGKVVLAP
ncbi:MAG: zinc-binding dehydrogenase family oxidoreductase [Actinomycetia bacterium]|nr:zinc-binding dehydrogenase family oxidoreductase [Actinomycetes bacterium]